MPASQTLNPGGLNISTGNSNQTEAPGFVGGGTLQTASQAPLVQPAPSAGLTGGSNSTAGGGVNPDGLPALPPNPAAAGAAPTLPTPTVPTSLTPTAAAPGLTAGADGSASNPSPPATAPAPAPVVQQGLNPNGTAAGGAPAAPTTQLGGLTANPFTSAGGGGLGHIFGFQPGGTFQGAPVPPIAVSTPMQPTNAGAPQPVNTGPALFLPAGAPPGTVPSGQNGAPYFGA